MTIMFASRVKVLDTSTFNCSIRELNQVDSCHSTIAYLSPVQCSSQKTPSSMMACNTSARTLVCSYTACSHPNKDINANNERIEVCTVMPSNDSLKKLKPQLKVSWDTKGNAQFHTDCWEPLLKSARARNKKNMVVNLVQAEKQMIKVAAKTSERHDGLEHVLTQARRIAGMIKSAGHVVAFTGAGISTSAGIGDFRGKSGKWTENDRNKIDMDSLVEDEPETKKSKLDQDQPNGNVEDEGEENGVPYEDLHPTYTHEALAKLMDLGLLKYVISQNADGLHLLSGIPEASISELHGNVFMEYCESCGVRYERPYYVMDDVASLYYEEIAEQGQTDIIKPKHAKKCDRCGLSHRTGRRCDAEGCKGHLNDTIINFCDLLEKSIMRRATEHARKCDLMLCLGTSLTVTPASDLVTMGKRPLKLAICNRQKTHMDAECLAKVPKTKEPLGSRVFGDCDTLMKEVMKCILSQDDLVAWENKRTERMTQYDQKRNKSS